ncbi:MAG: ATP synthase F1 subunit epsilon [Myxococcota bacterium]
MADSIKLELVTPTKVAAEVQVSEVIATAVDGEFGVLPGHALYIAQLKPGEVRFREKDQVKSFVVGRGFAEVGPERVVILTDSAEEPASLNAATIKAELAKDEERLKNLQPSDPDHAVLTDRTERNQARLAAVERR